jgi:hypothetical protein
MDNFFMNRKGETGNIPFRSGRFYSVGNEWYFAVRRGMDQGPYNSRQEARTALAEFINDQLSFENHLEEDKKDLRLQNAQLHR